jgi:uncharacterized membrane protein YdjX (TVP38/TMEM64 family)
MTEAGSGSSEGEQIRSLPRVAALVAIGLIVALLAWSYRNSGIFSLLLGGRPTADKLVGLRAFFDGFGLAAPFVYVALVIVEVVVAPIPGTMLYAPGGVVFGGFWGGTLSLVGNVIGAGVACQIIRSLVGDRADGVMRWMKVDNHGARAQIADLIAQRGAWVVFLLRVNPLTSSDLVSYAAGLTQIPLWKLMLGTLVGMAPLCYAQAYLADELLTAFPSLLYPLTVACLVYVAIVVWVLAKLGRH